ncbi:MAG: DUF1893 domain-containing protein [Armatimonadota bacterium]
MGDLSIAKQVMKSYNYSLVIVKDSKVVYQSKESGIKSFLEALITDKELLSSSSIADKVVGLSLAHLIVFGNVKKVYTELISEKAKKFLMQNNIFVKYDIEVPFILNQTKDALCFFESMAENFTSSEDAFTRINSFFLRPTNK